MITVFWDLTPCSPITYVPTFRRKNAASFIKVYFLARLSSLIGLFPPIRRTSFTILQQENAHKLVG